MPIANPRKPLSVPLRSNTTPRACASTKHTLGSLPPTTPHRSRKSKTIRNHNRTTFGTAFAPHTKPASTKTHPPLTNEQNKETRDKWGEGPHLPLRRSTCSATSCALILLLYNPLTPAYLPTSLHCSPVLHSPPPLPSPHTRPLGPRSWFSHQAQKNKTHTYTHTRPHLCT